LWAVGFGQPEGYAAFSKLSNPQHSKIAQFYFGLVFDLPQDRAVVFSERKHIMWSKSSVT
jgi:hypothetical protein